MRYISMLFAKRLHRYEGGLRPIESPLVHFSAIRKYARKNNLVFAWMRQSHIITFSDRRGPAEDDLLLGPSIR